MHTARITLVLALLGLALSGATASCGTVSITNPVNGSTITAAQTVAVAAQVDMKPADLDVTSMEFRQNGALRCIDSTAPYQCNWSVTSSANGAHEWSATARLTGDQFIHSYPVSVNVSIGGAAGDPELVGFLPGIGTAMDVAVDGAEAFVASAEFGASVVDIATPSAADVVGSANEPFEGKAMAVRGNRAVVLAVNESGLAELRVLDATTAVPVVVGTLATTLVAGNASDIVLNSTGTRAVAAMGQAGLWVIDLSNPAAPRLQGSYDTPGFAYGVELNSTATIAYVADGAGDLQIVSLSNPAAPTRLAALSLTGIMRDVALSGTIAYLGDQQGTLQVVDVANPAAPRMVGGVGIAGTPTRLAVSGTLLIVLLDGNPSMLNVLSIASPTSPVLRSSFRVGPPGSRATLAGTLAFVAAGSEGLKIYDVGGAAVSLRAAVIDSFTPQASDGAGHIAAVLGLHVPTGLARLAVVDTADPRAPVLRGELATALVAGNASDIVLNSTGTRAVAAMGQAGLWVIDLSNPAAPRLQGSYDTPGFAYGVELNSTATIAYVADGAGDLQIVSLSNPAAPTRLAALSLTGIMRDVALSGTIAYLGDQQGTLRIVDVSNPAAPRSVGGVGIAGVPTRIAVSGTLLIALLDGNPSMLNVLSIASPTSPVLRSSFRVGPPGSRAALAGTLAFVAAGNEGLKIYDLSNPASPLLSAEVTSPGDARDVSHESGSMALVADSVATLGVVDLAP